jgi:putative PIN family toxin of toxin-antitoxin system
MKVVIDCNVFIACLSGKSFCHKIIQALYKGKFTLALSTEIYFEYKEKLLEKYSLTTTNTFLEAIEISPFVKSYINYYSWNLITNDMDDNKYADTYITASADYLLTEDKHFNHLKNIGFPKINIIGIDDFLQLLNN